MTVSVSATGFPATSVTSNIVCSTAVPPVCTVTATVLAPVQKQDTFTVTAYDGPNATGNVLSQGSVVYPINAGQTTQIPVVLQGTVASIVAVTVANPNPPTGSAGTSSVSISAADAGGNVIVGQYQAPVPLQLFENDSEGLFSFAQGGLPKTTATVASSTVPATLYLKAKPDSTTPDDATIVATLSNAPFVPGTSANPLSSSLGEVTTACPATSSQCVFYPTGTNLIATSLGNNSSSLNYWNTPYVFPGTPQDPGGGTSIWNVPFSNATYINRFDTIADTFSTISVSAPPEDVSTDIAGSFWGSYASNTSGTLTQFASNGTTLKTVPVPSASNFSFIGTSFDTSGQLWLGALGGLVAVNTSTGVTTTCFFDGTDVNFGNPDSVVYTALAVDGGFVWIGVTGADQNAYVFKIPAAITAAGCDLTTLETPANEFELSSQAGSLQTNQFVFDAAGDAYVIAVTSVIKITPAGHAVTLIDTGASAAESFVAGALDPNGAFLYLVDSGNGVLYKASATTASTIPLPSVVLPPVFGVAGSFAPYPNYEVFFTPDGSLWMANAPFQNSALPFSLLGLGINNGGFPVTAGLDLFRLPRVTFAARAVTSHDNLQRILREMRAQQAMRRSRLRQRL